MTNRQVTFFLLVPALVMLSVACGEEQESAQQNGHDQHESFEVKGRYLSTDMQGESISVIHETVPEVMNAMRMNFRIDEESVAEGLDTGDIIRFDMVRTEAGWYARNIEVLPPETELNLPEELQDIGVTR